MNAQRNAGTVFRIILVCKDAPLNKERKDMERLTVKCEMCGIKFTHINPRKRNRPKRFCEDCLIERAKEYGRKKYREDNA